MTIQNIIKKVRSGVCKIEFYKDVAIVNSGSGFICKNYLITNNHVLHPNNHTFSADTRVKIVFGDSTNHICKYSDMVLIVGSAQEENDYAVLKINNIDFSDKFNFDLENSEKLEEGDEVILFGYPFEINNMSSHVGRISSLITNSVKNFKVIQLDASVNSGNSGGPLININTQKVIGIITRKHAGLHKNFDELISAMKQSVEFLKNSKATMSVDGVDPIQGLSIIETQMIHVSENLKRAANTGIGYAFSCEQLIIEKFYEN